MRRTGKARVDRIEERCRQHFARPVGPMESQFPSIQEIAAFREKIEPIRISPRLRMAIESQGGTIVDDGRPQLTPEEVDQKVREFIESRTTP